MSHGGTLFPAERFQWVACGVKDLETIGRVSWGPQEVPVGKRGRGLTGCNLGGIGFNHRRSGYVCGIGCLEDDNILANAYVPPLFRADFVFRRPAKLR